MAENSKIEWTDHMHNFWIGCTAVSGACDHCYAKALVERFGGNFDERRRTADANLRKPFRWNRNASAACQRQRVFSNSLSDFFDNRVPAWWRGFAWVTITTTPSLDWLLLTKRPQNIRKMLPAAEGRGPLTKHGVDLVAVAKTAALRERLDWVSQEIEPWELVRLLILAFAAANVEVRSDLVTWRNSHFRDLVPRLLLPGGLPAPLSDAEARDLATEVITRVVRVGGNTPSGAPAEWIGVAIGADEALPRFDTEAFLAHVTSPALREAALAAGIKPPASVAALRQALAGNLPTWRPAAAAFGAPAPALDGNDLDPEDGA